MQEEKFLYNKYSDYLKNKYGEKVYKLPINLPISCPNRIAGSGCTFCSDLGTGFEAMDACHTVAEQIQSTKAHIERRYKARKFIAYFQNYTNTFMPLEQFRDYIEEAANQESIVEISISTRPDCIRTDYLDLLQEIHLKYQIDINIELGLQTVNYHTLDAIHRGHGLAEFLDAVLRIKQYPFTICTHVILNLPQDHMRDAIETAKILSALQIDIVKVHSLYLAKHTVLAEEYQKGMFEICTKEEYYQRLIAFLEHLDPTIIVERLFSRVPEEDSIFSNWNTSWWKMQDEVLSLMQEQHSYQGKQFHYLHGAALQKLDSMTGGH